MPAPMTMMVSSSVRARTPLGSLVLPRLAISEKADTPLVGLSPVLKEQLWMAL